MRQGNEANEAKALEAERRVGLPLAVGGGEVGKDGEADYGALLALIGDAHFVLLGEASHGTHEFYRERARITRRLISEKGFNAVVIEGDWPDAYRVNRSVRGLGEDASAADA